MNKVLVIFQIPYFSIALYDKFILEMQKLGSLNQEEREYHAAAYDGNQMIVVDVWKSEEDFNEFGNTLMPLFVMHGIKPPKPVVIPVHNIMTNLLNEVQINNRL